MFPSGVLKFATSEGQGCVGALGWDPRPSYLCLLRPPPPGLLGAKGKTKTLKWEGIQSRAQYICAENLDNGNYK